jgi:hypothetical protein
VCSSRSLRGRHQSNTDPLIFARLARSHDRPLNEEQPVKANAGASQLGDGAPEWNDVPSVALGKKKHTRICGDEETPALALCGGIEYHFYPLGAVPMGMFLP